MEGGATMLKMLTIAFLLALLPGMARAADQIDRSTLSYDENTIINTACSKSAAQGAGAFNSCVAQQLAALHDHPSPDLSGISKARKGAINDVCGYLRRQGIGPYNDCVRQALEHPAKGERTSRKVATAK
jgi:hypothetical protein